MRTTLDIDGDVLMATKALAAARKTTMGKMVSDLIRKALAPSTPPKRRNGFKLLSECEGGQLVTTEIVNQLRDEE